MVRQQLFNTIFNSELASNDVALFLKEVTEKHPYFGLAHFYFLKNAERQGDNYNEAAAKTALYFTSNFYLQTQLELLDTQDDSDVVEVSVPASTPQNEETEIITTSTEEKEELLFEPLHASDYFASQGIKLSEDALGADKLGKQLKSFTAWLKTMKKVHTDKLPPVNAAVETAVKTQAEKSNVEEDIVTEPMAEAYILQKKYTKAKEIYNKLSLLNPAKSAYFAAKIDSIK